MATEGSPSNKSMKTLDIPDDDESDYDEYDSDRDMTEEEYQAFSDEVHYSDGFDVSGNIYTDGFTGFFPMDVHRQRYDGSSDYDGYSRVAVDEYNRRFKGELEFVKVLKVMAVPVAGDLFYITFEAKDLADGANIKIYQTKIYLNLARAILVLSFRLKPPKDDQGSRNRKKEWFWNDK